MSVKLKGLTWDNGMVAVFDEKGEQVGPLQVPLLILWARHAKASGYDPVGTVFETRNPGQTITIVADDQDFRLITN